MTSAYRVDREGRLLGTEAEFEVDAQGLPDLLVKLEGEVRNGQFYGKCAIGSFERDLDPVPVARRGNVLMPMHPVNKIKIDKLHPGQTWTMPLVNPLADALRGGDSGPRTIRARVLPELEELPNPLSKMTPGHTKPILCLVIEYDADDDSARKTKPRTWVRAADGLVVRQEADVGGERMVMQRDMIPEP
jgi:hypothetical protein